LAAIDEDYWDCIFDTIDPFELGHRASITDLVTRFELVHISVDLCQEEFDRVKNAPWFGKMRELVLLESFEIDKRVVGKMEFEMSSDSVGFDKGFGFEKRELEKTSSDFDKGFDRGGIDDG